MLARYVQSLEELVPIPTEAVAVPMFGAVHLNVIGAAYGSCVCNRQHSKRPMSIIIYVDMHILVLTRHTNVCILAKFLPARLVDNGDGSELAVKALVEACHAEK